MVSLQTVLTNVLSVAFLLYDYRICSGFNGDESTTTDSGYSGSSHGSFTSMSSIAASADFHGVVPRVNRMMDSVTATRQQLHQLWQIRKLKLEQCLELRLFEKDVQKVWIVFLTCHLYGQF